MTDAERERNEQAERIRQNLIDTLKHSLYLYGTEMINRRIAKKVELPPSHVELRVEDEFGRLWGRTERRFYVRCFENGRLTFYRMPIRGQSRFIYDRLFEEQLVDEAIAKIKAETESDNESETDAEDE